MFIVAEQTTGNVEIAYILIGFMIVITFLPTALWIWMLADCVKNEPDGSRDRTMWILFLILLGPFAAIVYHTTRRKQRIRDYGK